MKEKYLKPYAEIEAFRFEMLYQRATAVISGTMTILLNGLGHNII